MIRPVRVVRRRTPGFKLQECSPNGLPVRFVGRQTRWGNPFRHPVADRHKDNSELVEQYVDYLRSFDRDQLNGWLIDPLIGHNLACWCELDEICHADVLLELAWRRVAEIADEKQVADLVAQVR